VNLDTGTLKVTAVTKRFEPGKIYNGGSMQIFSQLSGAKVRISLSLSLSLC